MTVPMPLIPVCRAALTASIAVIIIGSAQAESHEPGHGLHAHRLAAARPIPPEVRYRDPRYQPSRRRGPHIGPPTDLIQAYLPRTTETPLYNEPPSRFPRY